MLVPVRWLTDYVDYKLPVDELGRRFTMSGLKIEAIERPGEQWGDVRVGEILELRPHPTSNKPLHVATVDTGSGTVTVVTGAQNLTKGDKAPIVLVGGSVPFGPGDVPMEIQRRPMAGIMSEGMLASAKELGISEEHDGIYILPQDAPVGTPLADVLGGEVLDIETVSNRPDTLSMIGVAREVSVLVSEPLKLPDLSVVRDSVKFLDEESIDVEVAAPDLCPRYSALRIEGVTAGESPTWLSSRLEQAGLRPINLLVDLTNYVMLEYGQPMHAFDATHLQGGKIVVRRARPGEHLRTLDGVDRALAPEHLVIANGDRAVAVAGVMGGEESEITAETHTVILESANFNAPSVRRTAQALGLRTDASSRFEKGLPPESTVHAIDRYVQLLAEISGAALRIAKLTDVWTGPPLERTVRMPMRDLTRLLGIDIPQEQAADILNALGFKTRIERDAIEAVVPFWRRVDIERSADLVEEVARIYGFDQIPSTLPHRTLKPEKLPVGLFWEGRVRDRLSALSVNEVVTHALTSPALMARLFRDVPSPDHLTSEATWSSLVPNPAGIREQGAEVTPLKLRNPATNDRQVLRLTLLPAVLDIVARNLKQTDERVAFYEIARTIFPRAQDLAYERRTLALAVSGNRIPPSWQNRAPGPYTFFDGKGLVQEVLNGMGIRSWNVEAGLHPALHPGRSATIFVEGAAVGFLGELHPSVAARFEIDAWPVQVAELDLDRLAALATDNHTFKPLPRFPAAYRDIAVVVDRKVEANRVLSILRESAGDLLETARIFDLYEGAPLPEDRKSIAIGMSLRSQDRTLTQEEVSTTFDHILSTLESAVGAVLRD